MAVIQPKNAPIIKKGSGYTYDANTFAEHKVDKFIELEDPQELLKLVKPFEFRGRHFITFDTETHPHFSHSHKVPKEVVRRWVGTGKKATPQDYPFSIQICDGKNSYIIYDTVENNFSKFRQLAPLFEDETIEKIAHNTKFDMHQIANAGMKIKGKLHDTVVLAKLADENRKSFQLRDIAARLPGSIVKFEFMVDSYKALNKITDYRQLPRELLTQYGGADVWNCYLEFIADYERLEQEDLIELYDKEMELMVALYAMERFGFATDSEYEGTLKEELQQLTDDAEKAIYDEAGTIFNINSGKQLYNVLMNLGVNRGWIPSTAKGNPQLDKNVLNTLATKHNVNIVKNILEYRKYEKLLTTYAVGIYDQKDAETRVHGNINQTEATTGRMSITKPALQTLPKKDMRIRRAFVPSEDYDLWFMDLDQIEYRLFAHYAKIPSLLSAIENGHDVHAATAAMIFHQDVNEFIDKLNAGDPAASAMRSKGKTINFALIYGVGIDHLSELLECSSTEATNMKAIYFAQMPEARTFIATVHQVIKMRGFVKNFYGRRRRLDSDDCYKAPNALIQGCAADYIKSKLVNMYKYIQYHGLKTQLILIVHDEIVLAVHKDEQEHIPVFRWLLSDFESFRCPITAGAEKGDPSWGQKLTPPDVGFKEPEDKGYLEYNVYDGSVFDIYKEV